jgi:hypothetical protein
MREVAMNNGIREAADNWNRMQRINAEQAWKCVLRDRLSDGSRVSRIVDGADVFGTVAWVDKREGSVRTIGIAWDGTDIAATYVWGYEPMMEAA